jgi:hypothetical protein
MQMASHLVGESVWNQAVAERVELLDVIDSRNPAAARVALRRHTKNAELRLARAHNSRSLASPTMPGDIEVFSALAMRRQGRPLRQTAMSVEITELLHRPPSDAEASGPPKSSAWLLAEGAFAVTQRPPPAATAVVTVRKSRVQVPPSASARLQDGAPERPSEPPSERPSDHKGSRVFRTGHASAEADATLEARASDPKAADRPSPLRKPVARKRRLAADRRPGPVLHIVTVPVRQPVPPIEGQIAALRDLLSELDPILDDIRRARRFRILDPGESPAAVPSRP